VTAFLMTCGGVLLACTALLILTICVGCDNRGE
jgi:hypothetical protein